MRSPPSGSSAPRLTSTFGHGSGGSPSHSQIGVRRLLWPGASVDLLAGRVHHHPNGQWLTLGFNLAALP